MTISNPSLIFYACISKKTTILAEFNSRDADLATLASKCLEKTPPLHVNFSHTVRKMTYTFLIDDPFVYFAIYDENLENSEALCFLESVKASFNDNVRSRENMNSHYFQGEFNSVFHQLLASHSDLEGPNSPALGRRRLLKHDRSTNISLDSPRGERNGSLPFFSGDLSKSLKKKKKKRSSDETNNQGKDGLAENKKIDFSNNAMVLSREFSISIQKSGLFVDDSALQKGKRVWRRHVWVVLSLDLIVCFVLFGVWLWICRGFKCIDG